MTYSNHAAKIMQNSKFPIRPCNIFFCICNIQTFFLHIFPLFFIKFARFIQKTPAYRLLLLHPLLRQEPHFRSQKYSSASQGRWPGGPEGFHAHTSSAWQTKGSLRPRMENRTAIMAAPLRGSSPCKAGQFISTTFPLSVSMKFRTISN